MSLPAKSVGSGTRLCRIRNKIHIRQNDTDEADKKMKHIPRQPHTFIAVLLLVLSACGGGGGDDKNSPVDDGNPSVVSEFDANKDLQGWLFVENKGYYYDLSTGLKVQVGPDSSRKYHITPAADGSAYVVTIKDASFGDGALAKDWYGVAIRDMATGLLQDYFEVSETIYGGTRLSYDKQYVAAIWRNERAGEDFNEEKLTVFDREGNVFDRSPQSNIGSFDWLPNGRIVYTDGEKIYLTPGDGSAHGDAIADLSAIPGSIWNIKASPDGSLFAFEKVTKASGWMVSVEYRDATSWLINSDGSNPRLFATSRPNVNGEPSTVNPLWTPDGNSLLITEGFFAGVSIDLGDLNNIYDDVFVPATPAGLTYKVPLEHEGIKLPPEGKKEGVRAVFSLDDSLNRSKPYWELISRDFSLIPPYLLPAEKRGGLPDNNDLNLALSGKLYYMGENEAGKGSAIKVLDIASGEETDQCVYNTSVSGLFASSNVDYFRDSLGVSKDTLLFSVSHYEDSDDETIKIFDRDCRLLQTLQMGSLRWRTISNVRFSPANSDIIAFSARDYNDEKKRKVVIYNWKTGKRITYFSLRRGDLATPSWLADGSLLIPGSNKKVYLSSFDGKEWKIPEPIFELPDQAYSMQPSPDGGKVVFRMARQIWSCNIDGSSLKQHTIASSAYNDYPIWSPDGRYILLQNRTGDFFGTMWIIASDAEFVRIYDHSGVTRSASVLRDNSRGSIRHYESGSDWLEW